MSYPWRPDVDACVAFIVEPVGVQTGVKLSLTESPCAGEFSHCCGDRRGLLFLKVMAGGQ
jgi:hypothetical protein